MNLPNGNSPNWLFTNFFDQSVDKAALAEHGIYLVKRKLFYMMNTTNNRNWPELLDVVLQQLNGRPMKKLNGLSPDSFNSVWDDPKLLSNEKACPSPNPNRPDASAQIANQQDYETGSNQYQVDSFVYVTPAKTKAFSKSFVLKVKFATVPCIRYMDVKFDVWYSQ